MDSDEELTLDRIATIRQSLMSYPKNHNLRLELIGHLKELGMSGEVREERLLLSQHHLLTEKMWMEWIEDELYDIEGKERISFLVSVFNSALCDCLISFELWKEYLSFVLNARKEDVLAVFKNMYGVRQLLEQAVRDLKFSVKHSSAIWNLYREIEVVYSGFDCSIIKSLYTRQLRVPSNNLHLVYEEYVTWCSKHNPSETASIKETFETTKNKYEEAYEDKISLNPSVSNFIEYIEHEMKKKEIVEGEIGLKVRFLFENCLKEYTDDVNLWCRYILVMNKLLGKECSILASYKAIKHCSGSVLWSLYLEILEKYGEPEDTIRRVYEEGLVSMSDNAADVVEITYSWLGYIRRSKDICKEKNFDHFLEETKCARGVLKTLCIGGQDSICSIDTLMTDFIYTHKGSDEGRSAFEDLVKRYPRSIDAWLSFIHRERDGGNYKRCSSLFKRAISSCGHENAKILAIERLCFESLYGENINEILDTRSHIVHSETNNSPVGKKELVKKGQKTRIIEFKGVNNELTVFLSNLPYKTSKKELENFIKEKIGGLKDIRLISNKKGQFKGYAYAEFEGTEYIDKALSLDGTEFASRNIFVSRNTPTNCKIVVVSNRQLVRDDLTPFEEVGKILCIDIEGNKANITYSNTLSASVAVKFDGATIKQHTFKVFKANSLPEEMFIPSSVRKANKKTET